MKKNPLALLFGVLLVLSLCSCGSTPEEPEEPEASEEDRMQQLLDDIDQSMSEKYDGCSISHNSGGIKVDVWSESISDAADAAEQAKDPGWSAVKSDVENSVISTVNSIQSAGFSSIMVDFNVLDDTDHSHSLLSFNNSGVAYDIVAEKEKERKAAEAELEEGQKEQPEEQTKPTQPSQPAQPDTPSTPPAQGVQGGGGRENNFNAHDNPEQQQTTASYVLNTSTLKFHIPNCNDVRRIAQENYSTSSESKSTLISQGYSPCGHCNP